MANLVIPDGGNIGSASDTDAISISSSGAVTFSQDINPNNFVGMIAPFAMATPPTGWLACDGSPVSKTTYSALFTALGANAWGTDTTDNFYLPDLRGAYLRGVGTSTVFTQNQTITLAQTLSDQFQGHFHHIRGDTIGSGGSLINSLGGDNSGVVSIDEATPPGDSAYGEHNSNGTPRHGNETRPNSRGVQFCIKF